MRVPVTTLDALIEQHGEPAFCSGDVEGFEGAVLAGLSRPLRALSFEYLPAAHDDALAALDRIAALGPYHYNYSPIETMRWASRTWLEAADLRRLLDRVRPAAVPATSTPAVGHGLMCFGRQWPSARENRAIRARAAMPADADRQADADRRTDDA